MSAGSAPSAQIPTSGAPPKARTPMAHLIHALNQPLTGLQCSLELAVAGPQSQEHYVRTLREGLELTRRLRMLVEAVRELADVQQEPASEVRSFPLDVVLRDTIEELIPVADSRQVHITFVCQRGLAVSIHGSQVDTLVFRLLESALALTPMGGELGVLVRPENGQACLKIWWNSTSDLSVLEAPELGLLVSRAGWEKAGAVWRDEVTHQQRTCVLLLPFARDFKVQSNHEETE